MYDIKKCEKFEIEGWIIYIWESTKEKSVWYLELNPKTSMPIKTRNWFAENLVQVEWSCIITIFDTSIGKNEKLNKWDKLVISADGVWHIHSNPFDKKSLTYWYFEGDVREAIEKMRHEITKQDII